MLLERPLFCGASGVRVHFYERLEFMASSRCWVGKNFISNK